MRLDAHFGPRQEIWLKRRREQDERDLKVARGRRAAEALEAELATRRLQDDLRIWGVLTAETTSAA